jgi:flagellar basal body-associated protein FliL
MTKKKAEGDEDAKGGGKKKIVIVVVALVAAFGAKTMLFKKESAAQVAAKKVAAEAALEDLCNRQNNVTPSAETTGTTAPGTHETTTAPAATTPTTIPPDPLTERGPVLELDSKTLNLADGHYLKLGLALQLDKTGVVETAKDEGLGAKALDMARKSFSTKTMDELSKPAVRDQIQQQLGLQACHAYEGEVLTVFFTDFVMQ